MLGSNHLRCLVGHAILRALDITASPVSGPKNKKGEPQNSLDGILMSLRADTAIEQPVAGLIRTPAASLPNPAFIPPLV